MAVDKLTPEEQKELNSLLKERERLEKQITTNVEKASNARHMEKKRLDELIKKGDEELEILERKLKHLQRQKDSYDGIASITKQLTVKDEKAAKLLEGRISGNSLLSSVMTKIVQMRRAEVNLSDEDFKKSQEKREIFESLAKGAVDQAKHMSHHGKEVNKFEEERHKLLEKIKDFSEAEKEEALKLLQIKQNLQKQEERIHELQHKVAHEAHHLPEGIRNAASGAMDLFKSVKNAGMAFGPLILLVAALGAGLHAYMELDKAAEGYRETTGFTASMTKKIDADVHHIVVGYRGLGVEAKDAYDVVNELANAQSDMFHFSEATVGSLSLLNKRMGIAVKDSAEVSSMFEQIGGLSEETAASVALQAASMAKTAGVSAKEVFQDMAKNSGTLSKHMKGNVQLFVQQAVKAKMLGTTLEDMANTSEKLLDFESGIEEELTAATYVGGQFNLSRARALAYEGKIADANEEVLNQIQRSGDFRKQDYFTQQQLAKAAGKSVEEITKELGVKDKLSKLSGDQLEKANKLIDSGVDVSKLSDEELKKQAEQLAKQERISGVMTDIQDKIAGMIEAVGGRLTPVFDVLAKVIYFISDVLGGIAEIIKTIFNPTESLSKLFEKMGPLTSGIAVALTIAGTAVLGSLVPGLIRAGIAAAAQLPTMIASAVAAITSASAMTLGIGAVAIIGGISAAVMAMKSAQKVGDVMSPADGKTQISTKEGGLLELSRNDDVIAAPGLASALSGGGGSKPSPIASSNNNMISALINEFRGVRNDMASGKIGVYMDNDKVSSKVATTMERSTRNNFALQ